jgi:ABC-2 type transport system permease protein
VNSRRRAALLNVLFGAAVLAVLVAANVLASRSPLSWDLTRSGNNTLAPQSVLAAKNLTKDLEVVGLFVPGADNGQTEAEALIGLYAAQSPRVKYRSADPTRDPVDVKRYGVTQSNTVVLDYGGKTELLLQGSQAEQNFTSALLKLESDRTPMVCWASGDGERSLTDTNQSSGYSAVATLLENNNFAHKDVLLAGQTAVPSDCDELAILDPTKALSAAAIRAIGDYLAGGGRLLLIAEPWAQDPTATDSLSAILRPYGVGFSGALVVETDPSRSASQNPTVPGVIDYGRSPITNDVQGIVSFFPQTTAITGSAAAGVTAVPIATTTSGAYAIAHVRSDLARQAGDASGPFTMMETLEQPAGAGKTRIVAVGTQAFAQNGTLPPNNNDANLELVLGAFQWLAGQDALIALPPKPDRALPLALTQQDQSNLIFITAVVMPGVMVIGGIAVWWRRRVFT